MVAMITPVHRWVEVNVAWQPWDLSLAHAVFLIGNPFSLAGLALYQDGECGTAYRLRRFVENRYAVPENAPIARAPYRS